MQLAVTSRAKYYKKEVMTGKKSFSVQKQF